jgi:hypothetical protein
MADNERLTAVGEYKRLGIVGLNTELENYPYLYFELRPNIKLLHQIGDIQYYLVESDLFALLCCPAVIPFYTIFYPPLEVRGVWASTPFNVAWDSDGFRVVENPPDN